MTSHRQRKVSATDEASRKGLGRAVEQLRKEQGMTQDALAKQSGLTGGSVGHIERGEADARWGTLRKLAGALDITLKDLLDLAVDLAPGAAGGWERRRRREARGAHNQHPGLLFEADRKRGDE